MSLSYPVGNLLTKIRNASKAKHPHVDITASRLVGEILALLKREGFIRNYKPVGQPPKQMIRIYLKYGQDKTPAITTLVGVSRPGQRRYARSSALPRVLGGIGKAVLTTSHGLMTDQEAYRQRIGGEVLCYIW